MQSKAICVIVWTWRPLRGGSLNTPDEHCIVRFGCQVWWGSIFGPPHFGSLGIFFGFFLLNLGSMVPNYSRRPPMRSSKAPPNQKTRGQVLPTPSEPILRAWQVQRSSRVFRHFPLEISLCWLEVDAVDWAINNIWRNIQDQWILMLDWLFCFVTNQDCILSIQSNDFPKCNPKLRQHFRIKWICQLTLICIFENITWHFGFEIECQMKFVKHTDCPQIPKYLIRRTWRVKPFVGMWYKRTNLRTYCNYYKREFVRHHQRITSILCKIVLVVLVFSWWI